MTQKAVAYETRADKIVKQDKNLRELYGLHRQRITIKQVNISPGGSTPSSSGSSGGTGNFLATQGDTMMGPIAFNPALVSIDSDGHIKIGENDRTSPNSSIDYSSYISMSGAGTPDTLRFIDGAAYNGQLLYLQGTISQTLNLKHATLPSITSISGTGTVSVTTAVNHNLTTGDTVNIIGTTNFDVQDVAVTVTGVTTFEYSDAGNVTPESSGLVQDGNIVTNDGTNVVLDGSVSGKTNTVPVATLLFDVIVQGFGAWRVVSRPDVSGGGSTTERQIAARCIVATTTAGTLASDFEPGDIVDGHSLIIGDRILIKDQASAVENGIYDVGVSGAPTRSTDFNSGAEVFDTVLVPVSEGTTNSNTYWQLTTNDPVIVGTDDLNFASFGAGGAGLDDRIVDGNTIAIVNDSTETFNVLLNGVQKFSLQNTRADFEDHEIFGIEELHLNNDGGTAEAFQIGASSASSWRLNTLSTSDILNITFAGDDSARFTDGRFQLFSSAPNIQSASMSMFRDDPSPTANDALADIDFDGKNDNADFTTYASILGGIESPIDNFERGRISFQVQGGAGSLVQAVRMNFDSIELDDMWVVMDEISLPTNPDPNKGKIYLRDDGGTTTPYFLDSSGTETSMILGGLADRIVDGNTIAVVNDSTETFFVQLNGITKFSVQNNFVVFDDQQLSEIEQLRFNNDGGTADSVTMGASAVDVFDINVLTASDQLNILFAGDDMARFADGRFQLFSASPNLQSASMSMFRDDPSPGATDALADLDFDGRNSNGDFITYVQLLGGIGDPLLNNEEGNFSIQVQGGAGSLVQTARFGHIGSFNTAIFNDAYMELDEVSLPGNPAADKGKIYLRDNGGITTPYFLDSAGTETSMILAGGGGGSGLGTVTNVVVSNTVHSSSSEGYLDVNNVWFGNDNGFENQAISLGTSNPGTPDVTYTVTANDVLSGNGDFSLVRMGVGMGFNVQNSGATTNVTVQGYRNGTAYGSPTVMLGSSLTSSQHCEGLTFDNSVNWSVGDVIGVAIWSSGGTGLTLESYAVWTWANDQDLSVNTATSSFLILNANDIRITAPTPVGVSYVTDNLRFFIWQVESSDNQWPPTSVGWPLTIVKGNRLTHINNFGQNTSTRKSNTNRNIASPSFPSTRFYQKTAN